MRLFVSIDFSESIINEVHSWIPEQKGWKKVPKHQLHLTLVFLGDCSEGEAEEIHGKLSEIEFNPFEITIVGLGAFPSESTPGIIWAGVRQNGSLIDLQKRIYERLKAHIKSKHSNSYTPHITLARKKARTAINPILRKNLQKETGTLISKVESFQLKQSILKPSGSEHEILYRYS